MKIDDLKTKKVLFFVEAGTLAHVTRASVLGSKLAGAGAHVQYAFASYFDHIFKEDCPPHLDLFSIKPEIFMQRSSDFKFPYLLDELEKYLQDEFSLIEKLRPDVILSDLRITTAISARVSKIPLITLVNAYWLPESVAMPFIPPVRGPSFLNGTWLMPFLRPAVNLGFSIEGWGFRGFAKKWGVSSKGDPRFIYSDGDAIWCPENPNDVIIRNSGRNIQLIGPLNWNSKQPLPKGYGAWRAGRQVIYVNPGSSGNLGLMEQILTGITTALPNQAIVVGGHQEFETPNIFSRKFVPNHLVFPHTRLFIGNGGAPSGYPAAELNIPIIGIASNYDQILCMGQLERRGKGRRLLACKFNLRDFQKAIHDLTK